MKILIVCDHYPVSPRVIKVRNSLLEFFPNSEINIVAWNRNNSDVKEDFIKTINSDIGYGHKFKKINNLLIFRRKLKKYCKEFMPDIIHPIDFEMLLISNEFAKKVIYEVYDIKYISNPILNKCRELMEKKLLKRCNGIILASPFFKDYYNKFNLLGIQKIVLNNKPSKNNVNYENVNININKKVTIGFVGTVRYKEILLNLFKATKDNPEFKIMIFGGGPDLDFLMNNNENSNVTFTGLFNQSELSEIYNQIDYVWAAYPNKDENVKYAVSNKFFESVIFSKRIIVSNQTRLGEVVEENELGISLNPYSVEDIKRKLDMLKKMSLRPNYNNTLLSKGLYWEDEDRDLISLYKNIY